MPTDARPTIAVWKFASCDGCQLSLLECEEDLRILDGAVSFAHFPELTSASQTGPFALSFVEGSISTARDAKLIHDIRRLSELLVTIGACATAGGIQALRNYRNSAECLRVVYAEPRYIDTLATATPIRDHVPVDYELRGCPVNPGQLREFIAAVLWKRSPRISSTTVCSECKARGTVCIMVARNTPCLGPVTHAGCGALCPAFGRGCFGCYGSSESGAVSPLVATFRESGLTQEEINRTFLSFTPTDSAFSSSGSSLPGGADGRKP